MSEYSDKLTQAREHFRAQNFKEASFEYLQALQFVSNNQQRAVVWAELSWALYYQKEYQRTIEAAENVLHHNPDYKAKEDIYRVLGFACIGLGRDEQATKYLEQSAGIDRESEKQQVALYELCKLHFKAQRYAQSQKIIEEIEPYLRQNKADYWQSALFYKGFNLYYMARIEESEQVFEELLENAADDKRRAGALFGLAFITFHRKDYLKTINLCETITSKDDKFFDMETVAFLTAVSFKGLGRDDVFEKYYNQLMKTYPDGRYKNDLEQVRRGNIKG